MISLQLPVFIGFPCPLMALETPMKKHGTGTKKLQSRIGFFILGSQLNLSIWGLEIFRQESRTSRK